MYVAKFEDIVYVLHCFQEKTEETSKTDIEISRKHFRELKEERVNA